MITFIAKMNKFSLRTTDGAVKLRNLFSHEVRQNLWKSIIGVKTHFWGGGNIICAMYH